MRHCLIISLLFSWMLSAAPFVNHNTVLIVGSTPSKKDSISEFCSAKWSSTYDAYWNDTYLMWEILYEDTIMGWPNDNIHVLFGEGDDWPTENTRYQAPWPLTHITDRAAYHDDVDDIFNDLAYGDDSAGIVAMDSTDNLFCWTFDHGGKADGVTSVSIYDSLNPSVKDDILFPFGEFTPHNIKGFGGYIYAITKKTVIICNVSDTNRIEMASRIKKHYCWDIAIKNDTGCVVGDTLYFYDLRNPENPIFIESINVNRDLKSVKWGDYIYTGCDDGYILKITWSQVFNATFSAKASYGVFQSSTFLGLPLSKSCALFI